MEQNYINRKHTIACWSFSALSKPDRIKRGTNCGPFKTFSFINYKSTLFDSCIVVLIMVLVTMQGKDALNPDAASTVVCSEWFVANLNGKPGLFSLRAQNMTISPQKTNQIKLITVLTVFWGYWIFIEYNFQFKSEITMYTENDHCIFHQINKLYPTRKLRLNLCPLG